MMRILVLHDNLKSEHQKRMIKSVEEHLQSLNYHCVSITIPTDLSVLSSLLIEHQPDVVLNLARSFDGSPTYLFLVSLLLEQLKIPYTGADANNQWMTCDQIISKHWMQFCQIPTPDWYLINDQQTDLKNQIDSPYLVKLINKNYPDFVEHHTLIKNNADLDDLLNGTSSTENHHRFLEHYIDGRPFEIHIVSIENKPTVLPLYEVIKQKNNQQDKLNFNCKSNELTPLEALNQIAMDCWIHFQLQGYAKIACRVDHQNNVWVLGIDTIPDLSEHSNLLLSAEQAGLNEKDVLSLLIEEARIIDRNSFKTNKKPAHQITSVSVNPIHAVILYSDYAFLSSDEKDEIDSLIDDLHSKLNQEGITSTALSAFKQLDNLAMHLKEQTPSIVFNLTEAIDGRTETVCLIPLLLEHLHIPYTGGNALNLFMSNNKIMSKHWMKLNQIPTPIWKPIHNNPNRNSNTDIQAPSIVKPVSEDCSLGIEQDSIINSTDELKRLLQGRLSPIDKEWFLEQYIDGREFAIPMWSVNGQVYVSPIYEHLFSTEVPFPILDSPSKIDKNSPQYKQYVQRYQFNKKDMKIIKRMINLGQTCWHAFQLEGYARIDCRVDSENNIWILEINVNPDVSNQGFMLTDLEMNSVPPLRMSFEKFIQSGLFKPNQDGNAL